jgi:hypothetical protein
LAKRFWACRAKMPGISAAVPILVSMMGKF